MKLKTTRGKILEFSGQNILEALQREGIYLTASCGGKGSCGRCKIRVIEGEVDTLSYAGISDKDRERGFVLACQSKPKSDLYIEIPQNLVVLKDRISKAREELIWEKLKREPNLLNPPLKRVTLCLSPPNLDSPTSDFERLKSALGSSPSISLALARELPNFLRERNWRVNLAMSDNRLLKFLDENQKIYSLAIDIGTTTVALALVDLERARVIEYATCYNSQISYGDDVITRIVYATENQNGLKTLKDAVLGDINALIYAVKSRHKDGRILYVTVSGNTTMCHIFWGISPKHIREEPYIPAFTHYPLWSAKEAGLDLDCDVPVFTVPSVAAYVGGDIVSGVLASGMYEDEHLCLFIDIGTNGEIVIGNRDWLVTASTSAGPCFEGSGISCGMRAVDGAVESFQYFKDTDTFRVGVIGEKEALGICGSGMIDILAELYEAKVIDSRGHIIPSTSRYVLQEDGEMRFVLNENCFITQSDIDNLIRAKAAIYAGITTVLEEVGVSERDIERVYIAGGFGEFLDIKKAIRIGMLPNLPKNRFQFLGNTSLAGAILCLLSAELREKVQEIANRMTYLDLSSSNRFTEHYISSLFIPHTDIDRFKTE